MRLWPEAVGYLWQAEETEIYRGSLEKHICFVFVVSIFKRKKHYNYRVTVTERSMNGLILIS